MADTGTGFDHSEIISGLSHFLNVTAPVTYKRLAVVGPELLANGPGPIVSKPAGLEVYRRKEAPFRRHRTRCPS